MIKWDAPTTYGVTLAQVKSLLNILDGDHDDKLADFLIPAALDWAEGVTRRSIVARTHYWTFAQFPCGAIRLPRGKTQSVSSIIYDTGGSLTTLRGPSSGSPIGTAYREDLGGDQGAQLFPRYGQSWPSADESAPQPVLVTFSAGWTDAPVQIKHAMALYCGVEMDGGALDAAEALLMPWRLEIV